MTARSVAAKLTCAAVWVGCGLPGLAQVLISPVAVEIGPRGRISTVAVTLSDKARAPVTLQAQLLRWEQDLEGRQVAQPTDEILSSPAMAELLPGQRQVFRVALRGPRSAPGELAYRLILEDVGEPPPREGEPPRLGVTFRMRYDLPVLVAPAGPVTTAVRWKPCPPDVARSAGFECVRLFNAGNRRIKVQTLTLAGNGWRHALAFNEGETLLAGAERAWRVPLAAGESGPVGSVQVQTMRGETLNAETGGF